MRNYTNINTANTVAGLNGRTNVSGTCGLRVSDDAHRSHYALTLSRVFARGAKAASPKMKRKHAFYVACSGLIQIASCRIQAILAGSEMGLKESGPAWLPMGLRSPAFAIAG